MEGQTDRDAHRGLLNRCYSCMPGDRQTDVVSCVSQKSSQRQGIFPIKYHLLIYLSPALYRRTLTCISISTYFDILYSYTFISIGQYISI